MVMNQSRSSRRAIPDPITLCDRQPFSPEPVLSPTSPLERNWHSPRGWKKRETDGIGLAIVASLDKSCDGRVSSPISIRGGFELSELGCSGRCTASVCGSRVAGNRDLRLKRDEFHVADFLNYCNLCRKKLHGKDIYMYRGEKAFCSMECRYQQIVNDEYQEKCGPEMSKNSEITGSPYTSDRIFSPESWQFEVVGIGGIHRAQIIFAVLNEILRSLGGFGFLVVEIDQRLEPVFVQMIVKIFSELNFSFGEVFFSLDDLDRS